MTRTEALTLTARLFGFFPAGNTQRETIELYAAKLTRYDTPVAAKAIDRIIEERADRFPPTWAEIVDEIRHVMPRQIQIERGDDGVPPPPEFVELREQLRRRQAARTAQFKNRPKNPIGTPVRSGDYVKIVDRNGRILWDYTLTGDTAVDAAECRWGADQCGLTAIDMARVMPPIKQPKGATA